MDYVQQVKPTHSQSGRGSNGEQTGLQGAEGGGESLLHVHAHHVSRHSLPPCLSKPFTLAKYLTFYHVFWKETLHTSHLAEFHQIHGLVVDHCLTPAISWASCPGSSPS